MSPHVRTRSDTTLVNSDPVLTRYVSPLFSFTLVLVPHFVCSPVVPPSDYAPLVGTLVPFRMFSRVSVVLQNSGLLLVVVYCQRAIFTLSKFRLLTSHRFPRSLILTWKSLHSPSPCTLTPLTTSLSRRTRTRTRRHRLDIPEWFSGNHDKLLVLQ